MTVFASVEEAIEDIRAGRMVVVCDDENRENEGDLTMAAQFATPDAINFMAKDGRGLICLAMTPERCEEMGLDLMAAKNESAFETAFTVSIEAREGVTTGISAADRAHTIQVAIDPESAPRDLLQPGHVFPLKAKPGGVLERTGQTEAAVDLARLAGLNPAGVICEIMNDDGTMARVDDLVGYCERHGLKMITVADLIAYRRKHDQLVERVVATSLSTTFGDFVAVGYRSLVDDKHHVALVKGDVEGREDVLVRVHSECLTGDVFHSLRCDCGEQLESALAMIEREGAGVLLYLDTFNTHLAVPDLRRHRCVHCLRRGRPDPPRVRGRDPGAGARLRRAGVGRRRERARRRGRGARHRPADAVDAGLLLERPGR
jgi:3,4-dihydroxy 2-butanone 4-phosphate synthase/GTP cyclohydrolase II